LNPGAVSPDREVNASMVGRTDVGAVSAVPSDGSEERRLAVQILATEQFTLQSARAVATAECSSRCALFLTVLSAAVVALALAAQVTENVQLLAILALTVVFFLGVVTYLRVLENGIEDYVYVAEMNRIRHFYTEVAPKTAPYFVLSTHDDSEGVHRSMGMHVRRWEHLLTSASVISVVSGAVGGVVVALAARLFAGGTVGPSIAAGAIFAGCATLLFFRHGTRRWRSAERSVHPLFA
jgi:hypothetical protein